MRWLGVFAVTFLLTGVAFAQNKAKAKQLYSEGLELYKAGKHSDAAHKYEQAYAELPAPQMLYNIGQAYRLAGNKRKALEAYQKFLDAVPDGSASERARKFSAQLERQLMLEDSPGDADEAVDKPKANKPEAVEDPDEDEDELDAAGSGAGNIYQYSGYGAAGVGVLFLGLGIKFGLDAKSASDAISDNSTQWTPELLARQDEGESAETKMLVFTTSGALLIAAGAGLYYWGWKTNQEEAAADAEYALLPTVTDTEMGFAITGTF